MLVFKYSGKQDILITYSNCILVKITIPLSLSTSLKKHNRQTRRKFEQVGRKLIYTGSKQKPERS